MRKRSNGVTARSGFTLIEVMVVMAILAGLVAGVTVMVRAAQGKKEVFATKTRLGEIAAGLEMLKSPDKLGAYPPTDVTGLYGPGKSGNVGKQLGGGNDKNCGIESVWVAFHLSGIRVSSQALDDPAAYGNLDGDSGAAAVGEMPDAQLREYLDAWGQPLVYIHNRDFKKMDKLDTYVLADGKTEVKVQPRKNSLGEFESTASFQLFSIGPDATPGTDDDVVYGQ